MDELSLEPVDRPRCAWHVMTPAVDLCERCGAFVCLGCVRSVVATVHCASCVGWLHRAERAPEPVPFRGRWTTLGLFLLALAGVVLFVFGPLRLLVLRVLSELPWSPPGLR